MSSEHAIAAQLFRYSDAPQAKVTCSECNTHLGTFENEGFSNDGFIQQAKATLWPVSYRDSKRKGWIINTDIAYHLAKPGYQFLYGPDGKVESVVAAPEPSEVVWRSVGKSMLVFASIFVGTCLRWDFRAASSFRSQWRLSLGCRVEAWPEPAR